MHKFILSILLSIGMLSFLQGQDKHFTQYYAAPMITNPALTGQFSGKYRVAGIYRDQWRGVLEKPYSSFAAMLDVRFDIDLNSQYKDAVAFGLLFFNDKVGDINFSTNQMAISAAFHKGLDYDKKQFLTIGVQGALAQRNVNYENFSFNDQFNGIDGYELPTGEALPENNFSFSDFAVGVNYSNAIKSRLSVNAGAALHHIFRPTISFYSIEDGGVLDRLYSKYSFNVGMELPLSDKYSILPRAIYSLQGPHQVVNTGLNFRILLNNYSNNSLYLGSWIRLLQNEEVKMYTDALVFMAGIQMSGVLFGVSYDASLSDLSTYNQGQGVFEFSIIYLGEYENESILCPKF